MQTANVEVSRRPTNVLASAVETPFTKSLSGKILAVWLYLLKKMPSNHRVPINLLPNYHRYHEPFRELKDKDISGKEFWEAILSFQKAGALWIVEGNNTTNTLILRLNPEKTGKPFVEEVKEPELGDDRKKRKKKGRQSKRQPPSTARSPGGNGKDTIGLIDRDIARQRSFGKTVSAIPPVFNPETVTKFKGAINIPDLLVKYPIPQEGKEYIPRRTLSFFRIISQHQGFPWLNVKFTIKLLRDKGLPVNSITDLVGFLKPLCAQGILCEFDTGNGLGWYATLEFMLAAVEAAGEINTPPAETPIDTAAVSVATADAPAEAAGPSIEEAAASQGQKNVATEDIAETLAQAGDEEVIQVTDGEEATETETVVAGNPPEESETIEATEPTDTDQGISNTEPTAPKKYGRKKKGAKEERLARENAANLVSETASGATDKLTEKKPADGVTTEKKPSAPQAIRTVRASLLKGVPVRTIIGEAPLGARASRLRVNTQSVIGSLMQKLAGCESAIKDLRLELATLKGKKK